MPETVDVTEGPGGKFEFHQHALHGMKDMMGGGTMYRDGWLGPAIGGGLLGYLIARETRHHGGHDGRGYDGRGYGRDGDCCYVNKFELAQSEKLACKDAEIAELKAEKYTDNKVECLEKEICELRSKLGKLEVFTAEKVGCLEKADRDVLEDAVDFVKKQNYVPGKVVLTPDMICGLDDKKEKKA